MMNDKEKKCCEKNPNECHCAFRCLGGEFCDEAEKRIKTMQAKLDFAINRFLAVKNQIELWKTGFYAKTEYCVEHYIEQTVYEALAKIKVIK